MASNSDAAGSQKHSVLNSSFPVFLPEDVALHMSEDEFQHLLKQQIHPNGLKEGSEQKSTANGSQSVTVAENEPKAPFVAGLENHAAHVRTDEQLAANNQTLTENGDVTNISSKHVLVDLFYDLGQATGPERLKTLLKDAWNEDPLLTLKIIFNARSIHLGKSSRLTAYTALSWLAENHPLTLLANLKWLVRPVIAKKAEPKPESKDDSIKKLEDDFEMVEVGESDPSKAHDIKYGMSHGYWKDLLNLVVFSANDQLKFDGDPFSLLTQVIDNTEHPKETRNWDPKVAKENRHRQRQEHNQRVQDKLKNDPFHRALHITVARMFAEQLKSDKALLDSGKASDLKKISLAAKWAPTFGEFHDKQTFIQSSIAEILFPDPALHCPDASNRELYLRHARELYRKQYASPLRKALGIVEREIAAKTFENIKYEQVPSLAMDRYSPLFMQKDEERFTTYVNNVTAGTATVSGATLLPSTLVSKARGTGSRQVPLRKGKKVNFKAIKQSNQDKILGDLVDGQWKTLVQRVRDAGTLQSSIAVCDVSGSMGVKVFKDGSCPMDSAIGLSLLISEVTAPPFGNGFITFETYPAYISTSGAGEGLREQVRFLEQSPWGGSTDLVAVFTKVILPMAIKNKLKQEDMVKQVFVFSDMQFNEAYGAESRWTSSFQRVKEAYAEAGYEVPHLIFWNLAGNSTSKPATMDDANTSLVSGYSQGMLRLFLETGAFDDDHEIEEVEVGVEGADGMMEIKRVKKNIDPLTVIKKSVAHKAYSMLEVVD
ncbi:hypothetical protein COCCADRAFT_32203 [Bipolaris zeicola 26-R-13]|uniref:TROVE domain-containing protein n=1 Tax=Cochliobolus carbonum (strain 26-R-13) TaxID=930089 RepID=W6YHR1_COCC2|nr:uncharacterized protein COCCADRAFT_32203 [Bipolaris zeicola 26-R-13]EUC38847.1 hypothetical protein COCCADRAFT_32203 [Bipolaris zeicola 26-R-13]